jgi:hypothetical protein
LSRFYLSRRDPRPKTFQELAVRWCGGRSARLVAVIWAGIDLLMKSHLSEVPIEEADEVIEETVNFLLAITIATCLEPYCPFVVSRECPEQTARKSKRGKSPCPDLCFVMISNPRALWSVEGKVLKTPTDVDAYCMEVTDNFMTGRYSTFSNEGAMLGYLLRGDRAATFNHISCKLSCDLLNHPAFLDRDHRISIHVRTDRTHPRTPVDFTCHHLLLSIADTPVGTA